MFLLWPHDPVESLTHDFKSDTKGYTFSDWYVGLMIGFVEDAHCFQAVSLIIGCNLATSARGNDYRKEAQHN